MSKPRTYLVVIRDPDGRTTEALSLGYSPESAIVALRRQDAGVLKRMVAGAVATSQLYEAPSYSMDDVARLAGYRGRS